MGPIATRCHICGCGALQYAHLVVASTDLRTAYALDYVGPLRSSLGRLLAHKPGSKPEDAEFWEDPDLHRRDNYAREINDDYAPEREDWPVHWRQIEQRWDGWWRGETPDNWDLVHVADQDLRQQLLEAREEEQSTRAVAWWDYAKGHPKAAEASPDKPKEFWCVSSTPRPTELCADTSCTGARTSCLLTRTISSTTTSTSMAARSARSTTLSVRPSSTDSTSSRPIPSIR